MTQSYVTPHLKVFWNNGTYYVSKNGLDTNNGAVDTPFLTIGAAITAAPSGSTILVGAGVYAEQVAIAKSLYIAAMVPGSTSVSIATNAANAVLITGTVATQRVYWEGIDIINTDNVNTTSVALAIVGGGVAGQYVFRNLQILAGTVGANAATAVNIAGNGANATIVDIESNNLMGGHLLNTASTGDVFMYRNCNFSLGPAIWMRITGAAAGWVKIINSVMQGLTTTEYIEFGNAAATASVLNTIGSRFNAYLRMNVNAGTGYVLNQNSAFSYTAYNQANQIIQYQNGDYLTLQMQNIDLNAAAARTIYAVPAGRQYLPEYVTTTNRGANTGAGLVFRYNGTGAGSIVIAVGAAALNQGTRVQTVVKDRVNGGGGLVQFETTFASGTPGDVGEATVVGRLV